jgi:hypothetical protein
VLAHEQARARVAEVVAQLNHEQEKMREAFIAAQRILATAGRNQMTAHLRAVPSVEQLAREGTAPQLLHPHDRAALVA